MTIGSPIGAQFREAVTIAFLGWLFGCLLFTVGITLLFPPGASEIALSFIAYAAVPGMFTAVSVLPLAIVLIMLLRRVGTGRVAGAIACVALGCVCTLGFYGVLFGSGYMALIIPAPAVQGVVTAYIYMRFSDV